ncbi:MAG: phage portal protein [Roseovarius sp.]|nr:phage portal protein [Roseovarius sp.]
MARRRRSKSKALAMASAQAMAPQQGAGMAAYTAGDPHERTMRTWYTSAGSADADLIPELSTIVPRSRDLSRNNGIASAGLQTMKDNIVGNILKLSSKPHYKLLGMTAEQAEEMGNSIEAEFETFFHTTECDAARTNNLLGLTLQALAGAMMNGETLAVPVWQPRPGHRWNTRIQLIEADRLATPPGRELDGRIRGGVEVDQFGAPLAYHIQRTHPGDRLGLIGMFDPAAYARVPAFTPHGLRRVIHLYDSERTGQSRGRPIVTSVMKQFRLAGKYADAHLETAVAQSLIAAFLESDLSPEASTELFGATPSTAWKDQLSGYHAQLQGAAVIPLPAGAKLSAFNPSQPNPAFEAFMQHTLRNIAAGLNIPYELLLKDFSKTNYSSARAALLEAWRYFKGRRRWLTDHWLRPIYELWMEEAAWAGRLPGIGHADYHANRYAYARCRWTFAGRGWVDPVKEANAAKIRMEIGISTLEDECAEQGLDWEEVIAQRARERQRMRELGLPLHDEALPQDTASNDASDDEPEANQAGGQPQ